MKRALTLAGLLAISASSLSAVDYYMQVDQAGWMNSYWETVNSAYGWYNAPTGGTRLTSFDNSGNYYNNGKVLLASPDNVDNDNTFSGASLNLAGGRLEMRAHSAPSTPYRVSVGTLNVGVHANGTALATSDFDSLPYVATGSGIYAGNLNLAGDLTLGFHNWRKVRLYTGTVTGSGDIVTGGGQGATSLFSATNALGYTGTIDHALGTLTFGSSFISGGGFSISAGGAKVILNQDLQFTSVSIGGTSLAAGTYSFNTLNTAYNDYFVDGGSGSITVGAIPEPSTFAVLGGVAALGFAATRRRRVVSC